MTEWCRHGYGVNTCPLCSDEGIARRFEAQQREQEEIYKLREEVRTAYLAGAKAMQERALKVADDKFNECGIIQVLDVAGSIRAISLDP